MNAANHIGNSIPRWKLSSGNEMVNFQCFVGKLAQLLAVQPVKSTPFKPSSPCFVSALAARIADILYESSHSKVWDRGPNTSGPVEIVLSVQVPSIDPRRKSLKRAEGHAN